MRKTKWNTSIEPITEAAIAARYPTGYMIRRKLFEAHAVVSGSTRVGVWYVLEGTATLNGEALAPDDVIEMDEEKYLLTVAESAIVLVCVWKLPW